MVGLMEGKSTLHVWTNCAQLNLKNDLLRRRFDSLKYDIKKIEEGKLICDPELWCGTISV